MTCNISNSREKQAASVAFEPITIGGRVYKHRYEIQRKYNMDRNVVESNIAHGLPYEEVDGEIYINEHDLHRYFSGEIGDKE